MDRQIMDSNNNTKIYNALIVKKINIRQVKMEIRKQVRMYVRNLPVRAED